MLFLYVYYVEEIFHFLDDVDFMSACVEQQSNDL